MRLAIRGEERPNTVDLWLTQEPAGVIVNCQLVGDQNTYALMRINNDLSITTFNGVGIKAEGLDEDGRCKVIK